MKLALRVLCLAGLALLIGGFGYDVMFAGIPYQDPTPEMSAHYERQAGIASSIRIAGLALLSVGLLGTIVSKVVK